MERISERSGRMSRNQTNENSCNRARRDYHAVGKCIPKKDSSQLLLGKPVVTDDSTPVAYTHLDVYKRQVMKQEAWLMILVLTF